ncbi:MAG: ABC transporter permease subunit [Methylovirgula sp.]|uniref:sulfate ABC transporter permease n=1 Tax=Methylovirgula sp. TaxID=1978224 RepID=UPI0030764FD2
MSGAPILQTHTAPARSNKAERSVTGRVLVTAAVLFLTLFIVLPVTNVFTQALSNGVAAYWHVFFPPAVDPAAHLTIFQRHRQVAAVRQAADTWNAIRLSCGVAAIVVPLNIIFGIAAAWAITKFRFRGRLLLLTLIDLPFSISPVIAGLVFVLLFGRGGVVGDWATNVTWPDPTSLTWQGFSGHWWPFAFANTYTGIIFTPVAIVLATSFVTFPFVARSLIPLMDAQGSDEELAALSLGASGWRTFWTVTLPNIRWGLLYGAILCTARAFGEFGAVSVVSGHIDSNDTIPLRVEKLWDGYDMQGAFAVSTLLALLAVVTLIIKAAVEIRTKHTETAAAAVHEVKPDEYRSPPDQQDLRLVPSAEGRKP